MATVQVSISISVDGFITGPNLDVFPGLGEGGEILHAWLNEPEGQKVVAEVFGSAGAVVTSRAIFEGTGGWGVEPPFHMPVFVLTHRAHEVVVRGETTFTFVTGGIEACIARASETAGAKKVHVMGGASVIQQALAAGLVDEVQLHVAPILLGVGTPLFQHLGGPIRLEIDDVIRTEKSTHLTYRVLR